MKKIALIFTAAFTAVILSCNPSKNSTNGTNSNGSMSDTTMNNNNMNNMNNNSTNPADTTQHR